ncbi:LysR substrate-binding domain-containing protein [Isoptericola sp. NPDC057191]|uniref:LysR substrate-binding domain-containing protein n=1 Tax=Isoptericola sp. NPDC057191 TaxID=3346041 RepID=UPI00362592F2
MSEITLRQMQYVVAAVDEGSVTAAAASAHASQAAASMAISQLEKVLGAELFLRAGPRRLVPTPAGLEFVRHARAILERVEEARGAVADSLSELSGALRVGCSHTLSPRLVPGLVAHFADTYPAVDLSFREDDPAALQDEVRHGRLDLGLVYGRQADDDLTRVPLADVVLHAALPEDHRLAHRESVTFADLDGEPAILLSIPPTIERLTETMVAAGIQPRVRWTSSNIETIYSMVSRGLGFSLVNSPPAEGVTFEGNRIVFRPVLGTESINTIVAVLPSGRHLPRRVRAALDHLGRATERRGADTGPRGDEPGDGRTTRWPT